MMNCGAPNEQLCPSGQGNVAFKIHGFVLSFTEACD